MLQTIGGGCHFTGPVSPGGTVHPDAIASANRYEDLLIEAIDRHATLDVLLPSTLKFMQCRQQ
jgi:hypothetical protein